MQFLWLRTRYDLGTTFSLVNRICKNWKLVAETSFVMLSANRKRSALAVATVSGSPRMQYIETPSWICGHTDTCRVTTLHRQLSSYRISQFSRTIPDFKMCHGLIIRAEWLWAGAAVKISTYSTQWWDVLHCMACMSVKTNLGKPIIEILDFTASKSLSTLSCVPTAYSWGYD